MQEIRNRKITYQLYYDTNEFVDMLRIKIM
jgi:hypothetical protein